MLYMAWMVIVSGHDIKKEVSETSIFKLPTRKGMRLLDKIMILPGVKQAIQALEVGYASRPQKGVCGVVPDMHTCLALI